MITPAYRLTLGDQRVDTTDEPQASTLVDLDVWLDMDTPADRFTLVLGQVGSFDPEREDEAQIELGYDGEEAELIQVMAGTVITVAPGIETQRVVGHSAAAALLQTFVDETFEARKAGEIVRDLAGRASVDVARAEDGIEFPAYVIDGRRSVYHHLRDLADLSGFDLYVDAEDELVFERFNGGRTAHVFEYSKHVLELKTLEAPAAAGEVEAWGESPGASRGDQSWAWLTKDFDRFKGSAGSGSPKRLLERPALRTSAAAHTAAHALSTTLERRRLRGQLESLGRPQIKLGDSIRLRDMPEDDQNAFFQVRSVRHRLSKRGGFTTTVGFRSFEQESLP